jgi:hypothetical protein
MLQQEQVKLLLSQLCAKAHAASVQTISNSLWAVVVLQQEQQWCMCSCLGDVQLLVTTFCQQPQQALPGHIQPVIRCMAQLATACHSHAGAAWTQWQPPLLQQLLTALCAQRKQMEMHHVTSVLRDLVQIVTLQLLLERQARAAAAGLDALQQQAAAGGVGEEGEAALADLAAAGGPQDAASTVVALVILQPRLQLLGLQAGVAGLAGMLAPSALPTLTPEYAAKLLSATAAGDFALPPLAPASRGATSGEQQAAAAAGGGPGGGGASLGTPLSGPPGGQLVTSAFAASLFAQPVAERLPWVPAPLALAFSSCSSGGSSAASSPSQADDALAAAGLGMPALLLGGTAAGRGLQGGASLPPPAVAGGVPSTARLVSQSGNPKHGSAAQLDPLARRGMDASAAVQPQHLQPQQQQLQAAGPVAAALEAGGDSSSSSLPQAPPAAVAAPAEGQGQEEAAARQLTHNIAYADSVFQLADIFAAHAPVMDMIHITACITRLSKVLGSCPSPAAQAAASNLLPLLGSKLRAVLPHANARGIANVLWGYGRLRNLPQVELLPPLLEAFLSQLGNAACRDSAVVLWSLARLAEGQGSAAALGVQLPLLRRLGRELLQQIADAAAGGASGPAGAQATAAGLPAPPQQQQQQQLQQQQQGGAAGRRPGAGDDSADAFAPPSSRDVSNSLMALARLGFMPEGDSSRPASAATSAAGGSPTSLTGAVAGLSLGAAQAGAWPSAASAPVEAAAAAAAAAPVLLTLPVPPINALVEFLLRVSASAKTLDLQETATALKQLGLRDQQSKVAAAILQQQGAAGAGPGMGGMLYGGGGGGAGGPYGMRAGQPGGRGGGMMLGGPQQQFMGGGVMQRPGQGAAMGGGGWGGGGMQGLRQQQQQQQGGMARFGGPMQGMGGAPGPRQPVGPPGLMGQRQQQPQQLMMQGAFGGYGGMPGQASAGGLAYGSGPGSADMPGAAAGYGGPAGFAQQQQSQQQQAHGVLSGTLPPQVYMQQGGAAGGVQYMLLQPSQLQPPVASYLVVQQQAEPIAGLQMQAQPQQAQLGQQVQYLSLPMSGPGYVLAGDAGGDAAWLSAPGGAGAQGQLLLHQPLQQQQQQQQGMELAFGGAAGGVSYAAQGVLALPEYGTIGGMLPGGYTLSAATVQQPQQQHQLGGGALYAQQQQPVGMAPGQQTPTQQQAAQQPAPQQPTQHHQQQQQLAAMDPSTGFMQFPG